MIARQHQLLRFENGYPAGRLQGLSGLVDHYGVIGQVAHGVMIRAYKGSRYDLCFGQQVVQDVLLCAFHLLHDISRLIEKGLALFSFRPPKTPFVFMGHVPVGSSLFFHLLYLFHSCVFGHPAVQGQ